MRVKPTLRVPSKPPVTQLKLEGIKAEVSPYGKIFEGYPQYKEASGARIFTTGKKGSGIKVLVPLALDHNWQNTGLAYYAHLVYVGVEGFDGVDKVELCCTESFFKFAPKILNIIKQKAIIRRDQKFGQEIQGMAGEAVKLESSELYYLLTLPWTLDSKKLVEALKKGDKLEFTISCKGIDQDSTVEDLIRTLACGYQLERTLVS